MAKRPKKADAKPSENTQKNTAHPGKANLIPWQPGQSGNPGGRPAVIKEVRDLARANTSVAFQTLLDVCTSTEAPPAARVAAAAHILDRGYGKPTQNINAQVRNAQKMTDDELIAFLSGVDEAGGGEGVAETADNPGLTH